MFIYCIKDEVVKIDWRAKGIKILFVIETDFISRGPAQHHHLLERLQERGHDILVIDYDIEWNKKLSLSPIAKRTVLHAEGKALGLKKLRVIRPSMIRAPIASYFSLIPSLSIEIIRQIKSFKPDVVWGQGILCVYLASKISKLFDIPFLKYILDSEHTLIPESFLRPMGAWLEKRGLHNSDEIIVINEMLGSYTWRMRKNFQTEVVGAGIDSNRFNPNIDGSSLRKKLGYSENDIVLFFMGWLYDFSGLTEVAIDLIDSKQTRVKLLILGRGDIYDVLKNLELKYDKSPIKLVDWVPYNEVPQYLATADICILPAIVNTTMQDIVPIKMYEYLACGRPVITTRLPGVLMEFGKRSGVVYVSRPEDVIDKAMQIHSNPVYFERLKKEAIAFARGRDWESRTNRIEQILQTLIKNHHEA